MNDFKLFSRCEGCRKRKVIIKKFDIIVPKMGKATSKKLFCHRCFKKLKSVL